MAKVVADQVAEKVQEEVKQEPNALLISAGLANALVEYLSTKPMNEVEQLVLAIRQSRAVTVEDEQNKS